MGQSKQYTGQEVALCNRTGLPNLFPCRDRPEHISVIMRFDRMRYYWHTPPGVRLYSWLPARRASMTSFDIGSHPSGRVSGTGVAWIIVMRKGATVLRVTKNFIIACGMARAIREWYLCWMTWIIEEYVIVRFLQDFAENQACPKSTGKIRGYIGDQLVCLSHNN